jgi:AhpC/TSA family
MRGLPVAIVGLVLLAFITLNTILTAPRGADGIAPGERVPSFALPLASGNVQGDANIATHANDGSAGRRPACSVRGTGLMNICQLYEYGPVVLALFVDSGSCPGVLADMQALAPSFPGVSMAAVAIQGERGAVRRLVRSAGLRFPVGLDRDGVLAQLYKVSSCPQVTLVYPGGTVQSKVLLARPARAVLRARIAALVAAAKARGWRQPA